jgi:hypothetical protein
MDDAKDKNRPDRFKDRYLLAVDQWQGGCLYCGDADTRPTLAGSDGRLTMPLCSKHTRWALAARRERVGKQARRLKLMLRAWCRLHGDDPAIADEWLGY